MTHFILCSGRARHGKDTSAAMIKSDLENRGYRVLIAHYADLLKYICQNYFGWNGEKDEAGRTLLQQIGTDCIRQKNPNYWVDFVANLIKMFPDRYDYVIVPDTRFPNEIQRIADAGFPLTHVRVLRNGFESKLTEEQKKHPSETALDTVIPDHWLINNSLDELRDNVSSFCSIIVERRNPTYIPRHTQITFFDEVDNARE